MGTLYGVDLSNDNWGGRAPVAIVPTLNEIIREGFSFIEHKVSEGNYFTDPYWPTVLSWAKSTRNIIVGYHYVTTNVATQQAATYLSNVGDPSVPCMLDFEDSGGGIDNFWAVWEAFAAAGVNMRLSYIPHWYWQQIGSPDLSNVVGLIASDYVSGTGYASVLYPGSAWPGWNAYGGATPVILQFTEQAQVADLVCDADAFRGTVSDLHRLLGTGGPLMALTDEQQLQLLNAVLDIQTQLRGPRLSGWPQLGQNSQGQNLTVVDALAAVKTDIESENH
ncbi:MAG TPA: GH25 family lysozyme [Mycobacterium sp.]|nr:GH25 family lysozyme [Mycobacterium sp.]